MSNPNRNLTNPPEPKPKTARINHSDGWWRVSVPKTWCWRVEWRVFFSKTQATRPDWRYIQIRQYSGRSKWDLVRSGDIRGDPSEISIIFGEIRRDLRRSRLISMIFGANLLGFCRFWRRFGVILLRYREICKNWVTIWCFFA